MAKKYIQPWMNTAYGALGTKEVDGTGSNKEILKWAAELGVSGEYANDGVPWCGLFVGWVLARNGIEPVDEPLWALNWKNGGTRLTTSPAFGCIMVFTRTSGGHVGFYVSEDKDNYHILGGNQNNMVSITKVAKARCVAWVWPKGMDKFLVKGRINAVLAGTVSKNEA